ncbi:MAG TPA: RNA methyltransferase [Longimicrobiales bacterium]|nr:RNA methyltransferase [Longimicrobiales bacterium]
MPEPLSRAERTAVRSLRQRKHRETERRFLAEGVRVVEDLLATGIVLELALVSPTLEDTPRGRDLALALGARTQLRSVTEAELRDLADTETSQGVLVVARMPEERLPATPPGAAALVLALDGVQDPGNFGTLVRSAEAFGAVAVIALPGTVDAWNPKAVRAAAGASFRVPIARHSAAQLAEWARREEFAIWGAAADGESIAGLVAPRRTVLVIGNEGAGLSAAVAPHLRRRVAIPIRGRAESLNAAMAGAVLLYLLSVESAAHD